MARTLTIHRESKFVGCAVPCGITLDPMFGAAAMSLSSFCVVTNALRLNFFKTGRPEYREKPAAGGNTSGAAAGAAAGAVARGRLSEAPGARRARAEKADSARGHLAQAGQNGQTQTRPAPVSAGAANTKSENHTEGAVNTMKQSTLQIEGMMCTHCEAHDREALNAVPGVEVQSISHETNRAEIARAPEVTDAQLFDAVKGAGYALKAVE